MTTAEIFGRLQWEWRQWREDRAIDVIHDLMRRTEIIYVHVEPGGPPTYVITRLGFDEATATIESHEHLERSR